MESPERLRRQEERFFLGAAAIVAAALLLRTSGLDSQEVWLDEALSFHKATAPEWLGRPMLNENTPPLYYLLLKVWLGLAGVSETALRSLSAVLGTLFVTVVIWAGREIFDARVALWAGASAAVNPLHIYYSQEARAYALLVLSLLTAYVTLWRALRADTRGAWACFSAAALVALYTHYSALLGLLPTTFLVALWPGSPGRARRWRRFGSAACLSLLLFLPLPLARLLWATQSLPEAYWAAQAWDLLSPWLAIPRSLEVFGLGSHLGLLPLFLKQLSYIESPVGLRILGLAALVSVGVLLATPWGEPRSNAPSISTRKAWLALCLVFPLAALLAASWVRPVYVPGRYDLVAFPTYPILLGLGLAKAQNLRRIGLPLALGLALALGIPIGAKLFLYYGAPTPIEARRAARILDGTVSPRDLVILTPGRGFPVLYYLARLGYGREQGRCRSRLTGREFFCRVFPRERELHPDVAGRHRPLGRAETAREDLADFTSQLGRRAALWLVLDSGSFEDGRLTVPRPFAALIEELERMGYHPIPVAAGLGIFRFRRS